MPPTSTPKQFQFGAGSAPIKRLSLPRRWSTVTGPFYNPARHQTVDAVVPAGAFADSIDIRIGGLAGVIDHDTATLRHAARPHWVASLSRGRIPVEKTIKSTCSSLPSANLHGFSGLAALLDNLFGVLLVWTFTPILSILTLQLLAAHIIQLFAISVEGKFDDVGSTPRFSTRRRLRGPAGRRRRRRCVCCGDARDSIAFQIFNGAVHKAVLSVRRSIGGDPRIGTRRHHQFVGRTVRPALE